MIKGLVNYLNQNIADKGIHLAVKRLMKKCNTEVIVKSNKEIDKVLKNLSGVVVANHPAEADVMAILSAVKTRKDVFLIINYSFKNLVPELDKHLIPVYIYNRAAENLEGKIKLKILHSFHKTPVFSKEEEHQKNIESINLAIEKVNQGGLVIIFPNGGDKTHEWFNGVGHLIHGIKNKENSFIIRAYIEGTSNWDYLRLFPLIGKFLPKFKISFANPLRIDQVKKDNPKETTKHLESKYFDWIGSVNLWTKLTKNYAWLKMLFIFLISKPY
jgi:1-acyl-sn-glycerol-3-phosphate acyltransferase